MIPESLRNIRIYSDHRETPGGDKLYVLYPRERISIWIKSVNMEQAKYKTKTVLIKSRKQVEIIHFEIWQAQNQVLSLS